jgi:NADH-quinone oxidoreductase subunit L
MAGPTPVSALIHAATMVTSGVYLMVRVSPLFPLAHDWLPGVIAWVGAITALFAATVAVSQRDIKKVLAYSTVSQLGYMFLAVGSGAYIAAIFHMVTHAFFKALLFLGAGSVIHGVHDEQDMRFMGALRKWMPITCATFIVGWLAIAGVPPFAGFWSKDEILLAAFHKSPALWFVGLVTALLTAFYMSRQVFMVFFGEARWDEAHAERDAQEAHAAHDESGEHAHAGAHDQPHESPWTMWVPLVVLALLAIGGGALNLPLTDNLKFLAHWLEPVVHGAEVEPVVASGTKIALAAIATVAGLAGIAVAFAVYIQRRVEPVEPELLLHAYHYDDALAATVGGPLTVGAQFTADVIDKRGIDGAVDGAGWIARWVGSQVRKVQSGYVRNYALGIAGGAVLALGWFLVRAGW